MADLRGDMEVDGGGSGVPGRVLEQLAALAGVLDADGQVLRLGGALVGPESFPLEEALGRPLWECPCFAGQPEVAARVRSACREAGAGQAVRYDEVARPRGGGERHLDLQLVPLPDATGRVARVLVSAVDITARKRAEDEVAFYRLALDASCIVAVTDVKGTITFANDKFCAISGYSRDELIGQNHRILNSGLHPPSFFRDMYRTIGRGEVWRGEIRNRRKDGSLYWVDTTIVPDLGPEGRPLRYVALRSDITERKLAEEQLRVASERWQLFIEHAPAAIAMFDRDMNYLAASRRWRSDFGLGPDVVGRNHYQLFPEIPERWRRLHRSGLAGNRHLGDDERFDRADGTVQWVRWELLPWRDAAGRVGGIVIAAEEVTERTQSEEQLRRQARLLEVSWDAIVARDAADRISFWSRGAVETYGFTAEEALGRLSHELLGTEFPEPLPLIDQRLEREGRWAGELRHTRKDGRRIVVMSRWALERDEEGRRVAVLESNNDVTAHQQVEEALRKSESFYRQTMESVPGMTFTCTPAGVADYASSQWAEYTGVPVPQLLGEKWADICHPEDRERVWAAWQRAVREQRTYDVEYRIRRFDGVYEWFMVRGRVLRDEQGRTARWMGTAVNIHGMKLAEEALREADRRKDEFIGVLAHELRNPLAPVRTAAHLIRLLGPSDPRLRRAGEVIDRQVTHMARLIDDLLDVSRISRGRIELRKEPCDLAAVARETIENYRHGLEAASIELRVQAPTAPVWLDADPVRLAQMIGNLLNNAQRFTEPGGRIEVRVDEEAARGVATVTVADTGVGIPAELLERLFDPFVQGAQDLARSKGGLGLGLALTRGLAALHGGTISAHSDGVGQGARFTLELPLRSQPSLPGALDRPGAAAPAALRVLLVEDNRDAAETLGEVLRAEGYEVRLAFDGEAGLAAARAQPPDVVICDLGLPGALDGYGVARAMRTSPTLAQVRLIALSGYTDDDARRRSRQAGFSLHLAKPPDLHELHLALLSPPPP